MDETNLPLEEVEQMNRAANDRAAQNIMLLEKDLEIPELDLAIFFDALKGKRMLDIGCGWGRYVSRFTEAGLDYTGIDFSHMMLEQARKANPGCRFLQMSYNQLGFEDEGFDGIWACCVLGMQPKRETPRSLAEIRRVLRPGGMGVFILPCPGWSDEGIDGDEDDIFGRRYYSCWEPDEFGMALLEAEFALCGIHRRFGSGSMTFVVEK